MRHFLEFEKPIAELESKIDELRQMSDPGGINIADELARLTEKADRQLRATYAKLTPWQKTQVARHPERPRALDYIDQLVTDYVPLAGDRAFSDDRAIVGGLGRFADTAVMVLGIERGGDIETRLRHNFGSARPEGYRKAQRLVGLAAQFGLPVISFVDTAGAFPGVEAEARGQAEAIARSIETFLAAPVPILATVIGEGGSGGAIAIAAGDRVFMLEHAIYSVISPEGCASILWRDANQKSLAADALKITAQDLKGLRLVDEIVAEPVGGAHRAPGETIAAVGRVMAAALPALMAMDGAALKAARRAKYLAMGTEARGVTP